MVHLSLQVTVDWRLYVCNEENGCKYVSGFVREVSECVMLRVSENIALECGHHRNAAEVSSLPTAVDITKCAHRIAGIIVFSSLHTSSSGAFVFIVSRLVVSHTPNHYPAIHTTRANLLNVAARFLIRTHSVDGVLMHRSQLRIIQATAASLQIH